MGEDDVDLIDADLVANLERCRMRIRALSVLKDGWHDGGGMAITSNAIAVAERLLAVRPELSANHRIYPTEAGGILFEFVHGDWDYAVEAGAQGSIEIYSVQIEGPREVHGKGSGI